MKTRKLGTTGPEVSAIGLGAMGMSALYGPADEAESMATIRAALDAGVSLVDTGDFYGMGDNEMLIGRAMRPGDREKVAISVKFGILRDPANGWRGADGRPEAVRNFLAYSLRRLGADHIDVYRLARLDPAVPIEETVGAIAEMVEAGYVRHIGLSEVGPETIRRAAAVAPISDLQIEYSLISRGVEDEILPTLRELGIGLTAYGVLSRGLLGGHWRPDRDLGSGDFRAHSPRFQGENLRRNLEITGALGDLASELGTTTARLAIGWVAAQGDDIVPLVGARTRERLDESLGALELDLGPTELARIVNAVPRGSAAGERYPDEQMATLDSER